MEQKISTKQMALVGLMAALICVVGPFSIPIPISPVPITLVNMVIFFAVIILGWKLGTLATLIYLLLGMIGVPVFSNFGSGLAKVIGPTGGYMVGYIFMGIICGIVAEKTSNRILMFLGFAVGMVVIYAFGTAWLAYQAGLTFTQALWMGVIPYIPGDIVKMVVAILVAPPIRDRLRKNNMLSVA